MGPEELVLCSTEGHMKLRTLGAKLWTSMDTFYYRFSSYQDTSLLL